MIWNKGKECMSRDELADLQGKRLVSLVKYMYRSAAYYRTKMKNLGMEPGDIRGIEDLGKLPFTTQEDLAEAYPSGVYAMQGRKIAQFYALNQLSGNGMTTGFTQKDLEVWRECMARSLTMANLGKKDVLQTTCRCGESGCLEARCGADKIGTAALPVTVDRPSAVIGLMQKLRVTGIVSTPSSLLRVAQIVEERGLRNSLRLKAALCGGEAWTECIRKKIQEKLGAKVYDIFGLNALTGLGVACECGHQSGMHVQEDFFLAEILDTHTLLVLPGGIEGELVFTTLQKEGIPLIRYRTMHMTKINYAACGCGRTTARIDRICEGTDDVFFIRGNSVFALQIESALAGLYDIRASYTIYIRREHNLDVVDVCISGEQPDRADVVKRVRNAVGSVIGIRPNIQFTQNAAAKKAVWTGRAAGEGSVTIVDERRFFRK